MKYPRLLLVLVITVLFNCCNNSDDGPKNYEGNVFLHTQADVNAFGKRGYKNIAGTLTLQSLGVASSESITDLSPLSTIESVDGELIILYCNELTSLHGFDNLHTIGMRLSITLLDQLTNFEGLENLTAVGSVEISNNTNLVSLKGLENVSLTSTDFILHNNFRLSELPEFVNLKTIPGDLKISRLLELTSLSGLKHLTHVKGNVQVFATGLINLDGLENLETIDRNLVVGDQTDNTNSDLNDSELISISGLSGLKSVGWGVTICGLKKLTSLEGLEQLKTIGGRLEVYNNNKITDLHGLSGLTSTSSAWVHDNKTLTNFCGLKTLAATSVDFASDRNAENPTKAEIVANCE